MEHNKKMTLEGLAELIENKQEETLRFVNDHVVENMATKEDLEKLATKDDLTELRIEMRDEMKEMKSATVMAVQAIHDVRVERLEKDVALLKKKARIA
jgi:hypothetical protein